MVNPFKIGAWASAGFALLALGASSMEQVNTGNRGVFIRYGKPIAQAEEGLQFMNPLTTSMVEIPVQSTKWQSKTIAYTKDVQQASVEFALTYHLNPDKALHTYRTVGKSWQSVLVPQVVEQAIKNVFGQSEAVKDAINSRGIIQNKILDDITKKLAKRHVIVDGFELRNITFSAAFEDAVEAKQVAVEQAQKAKNDTIRIEEEARQQVISAEAEAKAMQIKTQALAGSPKLVEYEAVRKWDGVMPTMIMGNSTPFISIPGASR